MGGSDVYQEVNRFASISTITLGSQGQSCMSPGRVSFQLVRERGDSPFYPPSIRTFISPSDLSVYSRHVGLSLSPISLFLSVSLFTLQFVFLRAAITAQESLFPCLSAAKPRLLELSDLFILSDPSNVWSCLLISTA